LGKEEQRVKVIRRQAIIYQELKIDAKPNYS